MDACRGFLPEDPAGSQGQTGNNGFFTFFSVVVLGREEIRAEEREGGGGGLHCPQMGEAGKQAKFTTHLQFEYKTDTNDYIRVNNKNQLVPI